MLDVEVDHPEDSQPALEVAVGLLEMQLMNSQVADPRARWLARRALGIACSDLPAVWLASGEASELERRTARDYIHEQADWFHRAHADQPVRPKVSTDARRGRKREVDLFKEWALRLKGGEFAHPFEAEIDPRTIVHVEGHPTLQRLLPYVDRHERRLIDSTDALALTKDRRLVVVQGKCTTSMAPTECPWFWELQLHGEIAVTDAAIGLIVCGEGWAAGRREDWRMRIGHDSFRTYVIQRDDQKIAAIRRVVGESWGRIVELRETAARRFEESAST